MTEAGVYGTEFAVLYDLFHASKPYRNEARFVRREADLLLGTDGRRLRLLDLACGTGTHAIELSRLRFDVTGVDRSMPMLAHARRKARAAKRSIRFEQQDLAHLHLPNEKWDVVTCLFDSIGYLLSDSRIIGAAKRVAGVLAPGGLLFVEAWHAPAMRSSFEPVRIRRVRKQAMEAVRIGETRLLPRRDAAEVKYEVFWREDGGRWRHFFETHVNRFFTVDQISERIAAGGFRIVRALGGFADPCPPANDSWHVVIIAERLKGL